MSLTVLWIRICFNADLDPDPACLANAEPDLDTAYLANADPDPIRIQGLMTKTWKTFTGENNYIFLSKLSIHLSLGLHKERPSYS